MQSNISQQAVTYFFRYWVVFVLFALPVVLQADRFENGLAAYQSGDYTRAARLWASLAKKGDVAAIFNLGVMSAAGLGQPRDDHRAATRYRQAADKGYAPAQFNLGVAYQTGRGVERNLTEAAKWWRKAAEQDFVSAQYNLGTLYYYGVGVPRDYSEAAKWFQKAADQGDDSAKQVFVTLNKKLRRATVHKRRPQATTHTGVAAKTATAIKRENWLRAQNPSHYTIQLFASRTKEPVLRFVDKHGLGARAAYFKTRRSGKPWYSLVYGHYSGVTKAKTALRALPKALRKHTPWVRSFGSIHRVMQKNEVSGGPGTTGVLDPVEA